MRKCIIAVAIVITAAGFLSAAREIVRGTVQFKMSQLFLTNISGKKDVTGETLYRLNDTSYEKNDSPLITDMILSFNNRAGERKKDDTGRYPLLNSQYESVDIAGTTGSGSALFYKQSDGVELSARSNVWLSSRNDLGSFTVEMRFNPLSLKEGSVLFSRIGYVSGEKNGIEVRLSGGKASAYLYGIFSDESGVRRSAALTRGPLLKEGEWHHYALSFDRMNGKLAQYIDGYEADSIFMTQSERACEGVFIPSFPAGDTPKTSVGKGFRGYLDECRITYRNYENLRQITDSAERRYRDLRMSGRVPINREGIISSPVQEFKYFGSMVTLFNWDEHLEKDSYVYFEFRTSDIKFMPDDTRLKWYRITKEQRGMYLHKTDDGFLRGKYYQWRARLVASPEGNASPEIKNILMNYELDTPPDVPIFVTAEGNNGSVRLSWRKNVDFDFYGYKIYYGVRPGKYDGVIRRVSGRPVTNDLSRGNTMTLDINNSIVAENRAIDSGAVLEYPVIKNNILYYFAVSAYDSYKVDTPFNHESKCSDEVAARPNPGSEIRF
jgi:hypothetical protein